VEVGVAFSDDELGGGVEGEAELLLVVRVGKVAAVAVNTLIFKRNSEIHIGGEGCNLLDLGGGKFGSIADISHLERSESFFFFFSWGERRR